MTDIDIEQAKKVACEAIDHAIEYLDSRFGTLLEKNIAEQGHDVTTDADIEAEKIIRDILIENFSDITIFGEELETYQQNSDYAWHIDPLDGTNNFAYAMPLYGSCIALTKNNKPVLGVIGQGQLKTFHCGVVGEEQNTAVTPVVDLLKSTFGMSIGYLKDDEQEEALRFREYLVRNTGRVLSTWAPTADWVSFAKGGVQAMIVHNDYGAEIAAGTACAIAAGAEIRKPNGDKFESLDIDPDTGELCPTSLVCAHPDSIDQVLTLIQSFDLGV